MIHWENAARLFRDSYFFRASIGYYYASFFLLCIFVLSILTPVFAGDYDIWYHLNAGRYIWQHGAIPREAFFSFLTPPRPWLDYYWLFQAVVYALHHVAGYYGLIVLRAGLLVATLCLVRAILFGGDARRPSGGACALLCLVAICLLPRFMLVRPHLFSYFFLALSIYILECRPGKIWLLPVVAVFWGNVHGVYYPVFALVCGAYAMEYLFRSRAGGDLTRHERWTLAFLAISIASFFLTPMGASLVGVPFTSLDYASRHVQELRPFLFSSLFSAEVLKGVLDHATSFNIIFFAACLAALAGIEARKIRTSHMLLFAGGLFLLTRGRRFEYEFSIMALPLLVCAPFLKMGSLRSLLPKRVFSLIMAAFMAVPFIVIKKAMAERPLRYPLSLRKLPHGVVTFLNHIDAEGKVLNYPGIGGYLEWALHPRYKIAADMQTPFLFTDDDNYLLEGATRDHKLMRLLILRYHPDFIVAPINNSQVKSVVARWPQYVPVFFDDLVVLYADGAKRPGLARAYALPVDPFDLPPPGVNSSSTQAQGCGLPPYLSRMLEIEPPIFGARSYAALACRARREYRDELSHALVIIADYPEEAQGYLFQGHALRKLGDLQGAMAALRVGLGRAEVSQQAFFKNEIAEVLTAQKQYSEAVAWKRDADNSLPPLSWLETKQSYLSELSPAENQRSE